MSNSGLGFPDGLLVEAFLSQLTPRDLTWFARLHNTIALMSVMTLAARLLFNA
jgi:hypothetical protein